MTYPLALAALHPEVLVTGPPDLTVERRPRRPKRPRPMLRLPSHLASRPRLDPCLGC